MRSSVCSGDDFRHNSKMGANQCIASGVVGGGAAAAAARLSTGITKDDALADLTEVVSLCFRQLCSVTAVLTARQVFKFTV